MSSSHASKEALSARLVPAVNTVPEEAHTPVSSQFLALLLHLTQPMSIFVCAVDTEPMSE